MTDQELLEGCKAKNPRVQKLLFQIYSRKLMGICKRYTQNQEDAEDVFQEAFVRVFKALTTIQKVDSLEVWIKKIVIHTAINYFHRHKKHYGHHNQDFLLEPTQGDDLILSKLSNEELLEVVQSLPDGYRMVFNLFVIEGYAHKEIAQFLGISESTSKTQLLKAKKMLKKKFKKLEIIR
ncbi:RNA polymerase sigma factor [uncultured Microscilla sp.]|uniref:RNA polymerase sigma factor n=1 Tax=uncultured Microscilla sp. TaxID=432653 RepID=UPI002615EFE7|nr:RNA polymerase sigma factor [uncultured Microscilla sp.]